MDQDFVDRLRARGLISSDAAANLMTHYAEQPNPARPYIDAATGFARGGLQGAGAPMPNWMASNPVQRALQNPDNQLALESFSPLRDPAKAARVNEMIKHGYGQQAIADEMGVGKAAIYRFLQRSGQKTVAAENPSVWDDPANVDAIKQGLSQGLSHAAIARKIGTTPGNVSGKVYRLQSAGELPDYVNRPPSFWNDPAKQEEFKQLVNEGWSQGDIASALYGGLGGKNPRRGNVSRRIKEFQERGELQDYVPQGGTGITEAGRNPTLPQTKFQRAPVPESDPSTEKAIIDYLRSKGLHAESDQLSQVA